jgi:hypothetical protein
LICQPTSPNSPIRPRLAGPNRLQEQQWVSEIRRRAQLMRRAHAVAPTAQTVVWATAVVPQGVQPPACPVGAGQHLTSNAGAPLGATFECLRTVCRGSGLLRREAPCGNVLDLAITRLAEGCFHGVWGGGRLAGLRSGLQPPIGWGTVRDSVPLLLISRTTCQQSRLDQTDREMDGRYAPDPGAALRWLAACLPCREASLLQQESPEEAGQSQRNSDRAPPNHVLKSAEALKAGRGVVCLGLVDLRSRSRVTHITFCRGRLSVGRYTKATMP